MPKEQLTLNKFEGGLNTDSDPRDIADNEFSALEGFDVDSIGRIRMMGKHDDHSVVTIKDTAFAEGYGIFPFSSSYDDAAALVSTNYLALTDGSYVRIFDDGGPAFDGMNAVAVTGFSLGETDEAAVDVYASFYAAGGNLRVNDGNFTNYANVPKLLQYIQSKDYGKGTNTTYPTTHAQASVGGDWVVNNASIETGVTSSNLKMINLGSKAKGNVEGDVTGTKFITTISGNRITVASGGIDHGTLNGSDDYYNGMTCSLFKTGEDTIYGIVYDYDTSSSYFDVWTGPDGDLSPAGALTLANFTLVNCTTTTGGSAHQVTHTADSRVVAGMAISGTGIPSNTYIKAIDSTTLFTMGDSATPGGGSNVDATAANTDTTVTFVQAGLTWSFQVGQSDGYMWNSEFSLADHNQKQRNVISADWGVTLSFDEGISGNGGWMPDANTRYKFYNSTIFDGNQESNPALFTMYPTKQSAGETAHDSVNEIWFRDGTSAVASDDSSGDNTIGTASTEVPVTFGLLVRMRSDNDPTEFTDATCDTDHSAGSGSTFGSNPKIIRMNSTSNLGIGMSVSGTGIPSAAYITQIDSGTLFRISADTTATNTDTTLTFIGGNYTLGSSTYESFVQDTSMTDGTYNFLSVNQRVTGGRIWWASNEDGYKKLYLLMEYDMERGARIITGESSGDGAFAPWNSWVYPVASNPVVRPNWTVEGSTEVTDPPIVEDYESLLLYPPDVKLNAKWKTSVVAGGRTYIGNIKRQQKSTFDTSTFTSTSCVVTGSDATITHVSNSNIRAGMRCFGYSGLPSDAYVKSITSLTSFELNGNVTAGTAATITATSTGAGSTVTLTTSAAHNLEVGDTIFISDLHSNYDGRRTVTVDDGSTSFTIGEITNTESDEGAGTFRTVLSFSGNGWSFTSKDDPEYADRIVGSPIGQYDTFPEDPAWEFNTTPGDGDRIIKLETFANRLIVFYSNKVEIFSLPAEELEQENPLIGLDGEHPGQACLTEFGVAWINSQGVYFYAGEKVASLSDKIKNMWVGEDDYTAFWKSDTDDTPLIAYDPESKKLMCLKTSNVNTNFSGAEDILQFSFKTQAWTYKKNALTDDTKKRFTVYKGQLVFDNGVRVQTWNDSPSVGTGSGGNKIHTKDYDFGTPGVRKKVYKVYVTYKTGDASGSVDTNIQVKYGVDGDSTPTETFKNGTNFSDNELGTTSSSAEWHVAELKPTTLATANNIKSFRLAFTCDDIVPAGFEINDITIVYRMKSIK